jgi:hypothetical protein
MISHTSIFILSYYLVQTGVSRHVHPALTGSFVMAGIIGFIAYLVFERSASLRVAVQHAARR